MWNNDSSNNVCMCVCMYVQALVVQNVNSTYVLKSCGLPSGIMIAITTCVCVCMYVQALLVQNVNSTYVLKSCGLPSGRGGRVDNDRGRGRGKHTASCYLTLPYLTGKACYRRALRPLVGPMRIPELTVRLLKPLGVFSELQE